MILLPRLRPAAAAAVLAAVLLVAPSSSFQIAPAPSLPRAATTTTAAATTTTALSAESSDRRAFLSTAAVAAAAGAASSSLALLGRPAASDAAVSSALASPTKIPEWTLDGGVQFPILALNTVGLSVEDTERAVSYALLDGITHVDFHPGKERDGVALYLSKNPGARSSLFLNTKIRKPPPGTSPSDAARRAADQIDEDLKALGVERVDMLMLRDSPDCDVMRAQWKVMEGALRAGKTRSLGVINYCEGSLRCLLETAEVKPALNYYMTHVGMGPDPRGLRSYCDSVEIRTFAYGAVGEPGPNDAILNSPLLRRIGKNHGGKSPEEVAVRWVLQGGRAVSVRPTTNFGLGFGVCEGEGGDVGDGGPCRAGLRKRSGSFDWELTSKEMRELDGMKGPEDNPTLFSSAGCPDAFVMPK